MRTFESKPAVREQTPLLLGLVGPSGSGKTFSALRLAAGIQRVVGGDVHGIDTESRRMLHYAKRFRFVHTPFGAPFSPLDYLEVIEHCVKQGAKTIVIDSMSHEHEGPGGVLEWHDREVERLGGMKHTLPAWSKPKSARRRLINTMLQFPVNYILCFRSKEKLKLPKKGDTNREPVELGWQAIAGEEFVFEMTAKFLLLPGSDGVPTYESDLPGEKALIKRPDQFREILAKPEQLSEDIGQKLAEWASGATARPPVTLEGLLKSYESCADAATFRAIEADRELVWGRCSAENKAKLKAASDAAQKRLAESTQPPPEREIGADDDAGEENAS